MTRTLNINFSKLALDRLGEQKKKIVLVKESKEKSPDGKSSIVWLSTTPFNNVTITWEEEFYLYGFQDEFKADAIIKKTSWTENSINDGTTHYEFGPHSSTFSSKDYSGDAGSYYMRNVFDDGIFTIFGLAQKITCGTKSYINPINAVKCAINDNVVFTPIEKIKVFMQSNAENSKVLSSITSDPIVLDFTGKVEQTISYDTGKNRFIAG